MLSTLTLVGEFLQALQILPKIKLKGYVKDVEEAIGLDGIEYISMPSQGPLEGLECISTHDLSLTQIKNDLEKNLLKCFTPPTSLLPDGLLCIMHSINPSPLAELRKGLNEGPWFKLTPALTLVIWNFRIYNNSVTTTHAGYVIFLIVHFYFYLCRGLYVI